MPDIIDISKYQATWLGGDTYRDDIDWDEYWANHKGVIINIGHPGVYQNPVCRQQIINAYNHKPSSEKFIHAYGWPLFKSTTPAQATDAILETWLWANGRVSFFWPDIEDTDLGKGFTPDYLIGWLEQFYEGLEVALIPSNGAYTAFWWWSYYLADTARFHHLHLWSAGSQYYGQVPPLGFPGPNDYPRTPGWNYDKWLVTKLAFWQYSSSGFGAGVGNKVDVNKAFYIPSQQQEEDDMAGETVKLFEDTLIRLYCNLDSDFYNGNDQPPVPIPSHESGLALAKFRMYNNHSPLDDLIAGAVAGHEQKPHGGVDSLKQTIKITGTYQRLRKVL